MTATASGVRPAGRPDSTVPERLLGSAVRLFSEKGVSNTSVQEIVDAVDLTKGALYHYFASKDDLLYEIYARLLRMQQARLDEIIVLDLPVDQRLHRAATDVVATTLEGMDEARVFFRSYYMLPEDRRAGIRDARRHFAARFASMIEEGQADGTFRRDGLPVKVRIYHFIGAISYLQVWFRPDGRYSIAEVARMYADDLLHSLR
ncbi:MAG: TetR/AcrR family transcriptional regulator [Actinomycetia bacterium]|nr:TetR/AcrR family transcriptional regulator [Actinomycetes bacterium]